MKYYDVTVVVGFEEGCMVFKHIAGFKEDDYMVENPQWAEVVENVFTNRLKMKYDRDFPFNLYVSIYYKEKEKNYYPFE